MAKRDKKNIAVFIDRDGTIVKERHYLRKVKDIKLLSGVIKALKLLKDRDFKIVIVTNQSGIGRGYLTEKKLKQINNYLIKLLKRKGAGVDALYYCPHLPDDGCICRKPKLGMIEKAKKKFNLDLKRSFSIGDHTNDFLLGQNMGGTGIFILTGHGKEEYIKIKNSKGKLKPDVLEKNLLTAALWIMKHT
ncbi:MAG: HAD family hydrolase [Elusimicrobia bacterium]|nr:HAD family hydrolase [Candidatus Liberimonas magnetica]